jgi:hypothetical protein
MGCELTQKFIFGGFAFGVEKWVDRHECVTAWFVFIFGVVGVDELGLTFAVRFALF